jgi:multidrug resistance efflux pump
VVTHVEGLALPKSLRRANFIIESVVGGRIVELAVSENAKVSTGKFLFRSDPVPYRLLSSRLKLILGSP